MATLLGDSGNNTINGGSSSDNLLGLGGDDLLYGYAGNDTIDGGEANDTIDAGSGYNTVIGGNGNDVLVVDYSANTFDGVYASFEAGANIYFSNNSTGTGQAYSLLSTSGQFDLINFSGIEQIHITGTNLKDEFSGGLGDDTLIGLEGGDSLFGGSGNDSMVGGGGNDLYRLDSVGDIVVELSGEGNDTIEASITYTLPTYIETLKLTGSAAINGTGNHFANSLSGNAQANILTGLGGNDTYEVGYNDTVVEAASAGTDVVNASYHFTLSANVEQLFLTGSSDSDGTGNELANIISGNTGDNSLLGAAGNDSVTAGDGDDFLNGTNYSALGMSEIDTLTGGSGADIFALGGPAGSSYDDENTSASGVADYALITDFQPGTDRILVKGSPTEYYIDGSPIAGLTGTAVYKEEGATDELIAIVQSTESLTYDTLLEPAGDASMLALISQYRWPAGTTSMSYTFQSLDQGVEGQFNAAQQAGARAALAEVSKICGIDFLEVSGTSADLRFFQDDLDPGTAGYAYYPTDGRIFLDVEYSETSDFTGGNYGFLVLLHEIGHALGLKHTFQGDPVLTDTEDSLNTSVMSYSGSNSSSVGGQVALQFSPFVPQSYQIYDIAALQSLYGARRDTTGNNGNTPHGFSSTVGEVRTLWDGGGNDTLSITDPAETHSNAVLDLREGPSFVSRYGSSYRWIASGSNIENAEGGKGNDTLIGSVDDNYLNGGTGNDSMTGGLGNDTYAIDSASDAIIETSTSLVEVDLVNATISYSLAALTNVENLTLLSSAVSGTGNSRANQLKGNGLGNSLDGGSGNDSINGGDGADSMTGGPGNDSFTVDNVADVILESSSSTTEIDTVLASITYSINSTPNVENLTIAGSSSINGTGNALNNTLLGNSGANALFGNGGNDSLVGGVGADSLTGGSGNDTYSVDNVGDQTIETNSSSTELDSVLASITWSLGAYVENLTLTGTSAILGNGNGLANIITGNAAANTLNGKDGLDTLIGGNGNDLYMVDHPAEQVTEVNSAATQVDSVRSTSSFSLGPNVENLTLLGSSSLDGTGNSLANELIGNAATNKLLGLAGNDTLQGLGGSDTLTGGTGNDLYRVETAGVTVQETSTATTEIDTVQSSVGFILGPNVENLLLTGTAAIGGTGNAQANTLTGNSAANTLNGKTGNDTMIGGTGNDTYIVDSRNDSVTETSPLSTELDTVQSSVQFTLGSNVEALRLIGTAPISGTGNSAANTLTGNSAANTLDGKAGNDTMIGGVGNDIYLVDSSGDVVKETSTLGSELDIVKSSVTLGLSANFEALQLTGSTNINGTGNGLANTITGNSGANLLKGGAKNDLLNGAGGSDKLDGVNSSTRGRGEIDTLTGGSGTNTFVLGISSGEFYSDGVAQNSGSADYALITDFTVSADILQLHGLASNYFLGASPISGLNGKGLFLETGTVDELVAVIQSSDSTVLTKTNTITTATFV